MLISSHLLKRGAKFWKTGQKEQARAIFKAIIHNDQKNEIAWFWYIYSLEYTQEKILALEKLLTIFPENQKAQLALQGLRSQESKILPQHSNTDTPITNAQNTMSLVQPFKEKQLQPSHTHKKVNTISQSAGFIPTKIVIFGTLSLISISIILFAYLSALKTQYNSEKQTRQLLGLQLEQLEKKHQAISTDYEKISQTYNILAGQYSNLQQEHNTLITQFDNLNQDYQNRITEYKLLTDKYNTLQIDFRNLTGQYDNLNNVAVRPPYILVHDRTVDTAFYDSDGQLIKWTTPFEALESDIENGTLMRQLIVNLSMKTHLVYTQNNQKLYLRDFSPFITPNTFKNVIPDLYYKSSSSYDFIQRVWSMIGQLSNYASEDIETPRYPLETLLAGGGDCEDLSILYASMIKAAPVDWYVDILYVDSNNLLNPQSPDHVVVYINTGQEIFIVETTSNQNMLPYSNGITGWLASKLSTNIQYKYPEFLR